MIITTLLFLQKSMGSILDRLKKTIFVCRIQNLSSFRSVFLFFPGNLSYRQKLEGRVIFWKQSLFKRYAGFRKLAHGEQCGRTRWSLLKYEECPWFPHYLELPSKSAGEASCRCTSHCLCCRRGSGRKQDMGRQQWAQRNHIPMHFICHFLIRHY